MKIPELLFPLCMREIVRDEQVLTFWHDSYIEVFDPGTTATYTFRPRVGYVYLVFGITYGRPRDFDTGDVLTTDDFGFRHRHSQMLWHDNPMLESIYEYREPQFLKVTRDDPLEMEFYNNTDLKVIIDFNVHILECGLQHWPIVQQYLKGLFNMFYVRGKGE